MISIDKQGKAARRAATNCCVNRLLRVGLTLCTSMANGENRRHLHFWRKFFKNFRIFKNGGHICNQHDKCSQMSTNKPMFGPVVVEIACNIFIYKDVFIPLKHVVKRGEN